MPTCGGVIGSPRARRVIESHYSAASSERDRWNTALETAVFKVADHDGHLGSLCRLGNESKVLEKRIGG